MVADMEAATEAETGTVGLEEEGRVVMAAVIAEVAMVMAVKVEVAMAAAVTAEVATAAVIAEVATCLEARFYILACTRGCP